MKTKPGDYVLRCYNGSPKPKDEIRAAIGERVWKVLEVRKTGNIMVSSNGTIIFLKSWIRKNL